MFLLNLRVSWLCAPEWIAFLWRQGEANQCLRFLKIKARDKIFPTCGDLCWWPCWCCDKQYQETTFAPPNTRPSPSLGQKQILATEKVSFFSLEMEDNINELFGSSEAIKVWKLCWLCSCFSVLSLLFCLGVHLLSLPFPPLPGSFPEHAAKATGSQSWQTPCSEGQQWRVPSTTDCTGRKGCSTGLRVWLLLWSSLTALAFFLPHEMIHLSFAARLQNAYNVFIKMKCIGSTGRECLRSHSGLG